MTEKHKENRKKFAFLYLSWTLEWNLVLFSDEKKFSLNGPDGIHRIWINENLEEHRKKEQLIRKKNNPKKSILVWGSIGYKFKSNLVFIDSIINSEDYCEILKNNLVPHLKTKIGSRKIFQQDNAPIHVSGHSEGFFKKNKINLLEWPSLSPDLNPIENVWGYLTQQIYSNRSCFSNIDELKESILDAWNSLEFRYIEELISSMQKRLEMVVKRDGDVIVY